MLRRYKSWRQPVRDMYYRIMLLKVLLLFTLVQIILGASYQEYVIKNKYSGMVLDGESRHVQIEQWKNKKSQLWTLEGTQRSSTYILHNVGNGKVLHASSRTKSILTRSKHSGNTQLWTMTPGGETYLKPKYYPTLFLVQDRFQPTLNNTYRFDGTDKWILVKRNDA